MTFLFLGSSLAHLEPKLQLFEVDDHGDAGNDDLSQWSSGKTIFPQDLSEEVNGSETTEVKEPCWKENDFSISWLEDILLIL